MTEAEWNGSADPGRMLAYLSDRDGGGHNQRVAVATDRKLRLWACGCCRLVWPLLADPRSRAAVETAERFADGTVTDLDFALAADMAGNARRESPACLWNNQTPDQKQDMAALAVCNLFQPAAENAANECRRLTRPPAAQAGLLRCVAGSPFRAATLKWDGDKLCETKYAHHGMSSKLSEYLNPVLWLTPTVLALAGAACSEPRRCGACGGGGFAEDAPLSCNICHGSGTDGLLDNDNLARLSDALEESGYADAALLAHLRSPGPHVRGCHVLDLLLNKE